MADRKETNKYTFTVEGETEMWYLNWLTDRINNCAEAKCRVSITAKVCQNPLKFAKTATKLSAPDIAHICDVESNDADHQKKFRDIIDQVNAANGLGKGINYELKYSNFTFELWMALHKVECNGPLTHRTGYLQHIRRAFGEDFEDLDHYKREAAFRRCLGKLTLDDVKTAVKRARLIMARNEKDPGKVPVMYNGFSYYQENPSLTIWEAVAKILTECGV